VSYAFVQDIAASWRDYQQVAAALVDPPPTGLILHAAGPTDEGVRVIAIWDDEPACQRFRRERLEPAIARLGGPARPQPTFRDLHAAQLVVCGRDAGRALLTQAREGLQ
jgi:hypothetical protein